MHVIATKTFARNLRLAIPLSVAVAAALTIIGLMRYEPNISPIPEILKGGRGYPLIYITNTYRSLFPDVATGYSMIVSNLIIDFLIWLTVAFVLVVALWALLIIRRGSPQSM